MFSLQSQCNHLRIVDPPSSTNVTKLSESGFQRLVRMSGKFLWGPNVLGSGKFEEITMHVRLIMFTVPLVYL